MRALFPLCLLFPVLSPAQETAPAEAKITVDPRIELLATVQLLAGYDRTGLITKYDVAYREELRDHFADFKEHPAVELFAKYAQRGFAYDKPVSAMLHYEGVPELEVAHALPPVWQQQNGVQMVEEFMIEMSAFAEESEFMDFFESHAEYYRQLESKVAEIIGDVTSMRGLEEYYGYGQRSYTFILAPIFHHGGFGPRVILADGTANVFSVQGPVAAANGIPSFGDREAFRYLRDHEFSHSYINPLTEEHREQVAGFEPLFEPMRQKMSEQAYGNWQTCVNEHIVRAVTVRLAYHQSEEEGSRALEYETGRGFVYVGELCEKLAKYEGNRDAYPSFKDFYPELLMVFAEAMERR
ncbi:MAG: DUF4932 domain-containing protein [Planctomycetota bacterium]|jgi:hypothetical protein